MSKWPKAVFVTIAVIASIFGSAAAIAQSDWPSKPIVYIVPYPPGGTTDILGRIIAQRLGVALNATIIVENKPGATGTIGSAFVARAAPDGYTLLGTSIGPQAIVPNLMSHMPYDPVTAFEPVVLVGKVPHLLVVNSASPYRSLKDLITAAKGRPGSLTFASGGSGTILQMQGELLKIEAGIDMAHVPYKGDTPAIQDVLSGQVTTMFVPVTAAMQHVQSGKLRALAVTSARRIKDLPNVPTMTEAGMPNFEVEQWQAIYAPARTPKAIVQRLNSEIVHILRQPDVAERLQKLGVVPVGSTPEELADVQRADTTRWAKVIRSAKITAD